MSAPYTVSMPPSLYLWDSCIVRITAIDPTTGSVVSGVNITRGALQVEEITAGAPGGGGDTVIGPFMLVPGPGA